MIINSAERICDISEYYFSRKLEQIRDLNLNGKDVINLGIGSPDLMASDSTVDQAKKALDISINHGYSSQRATPDLRIAISDWYQKTYLVKLNPTCEILPLLGSKEGIFYISMAFLDAKDEALIPNPGYPTYKIATKLAGAKVRYYDLLDKNNWYPDFSILNDLDLTNVKLMWVNYPNMPTGTPATEKLFKDLIDFSKKHNILICHDNPYSLILNKNRPLSILQFDPSFSNSLELNSLSKGFNMAGWRVGMLLAHKEVVDTVLKVKSNVDSGMFLPIQRAAEVALKNPKEWHEKRNEVYQSRRELIYKIFDKLKLSYKKDTQEGLFIWAKVPDVISNVEKYVDDILLKNSIFFAPGSIFGSNGERYIRSSLCQPVERIKEALNRLG